MLYPVTELDESIRLVLIDIYGDGTLWFSLEDGQGRRATACIDGRKSSPTRYRLFDRGRHPSKPGTVLIQLGADEEAIIVPLASRWLDSDEPKNLGLTGFGWDMCREALDRLGDEPD